MHSKPAVIAHRGASAHAPEHTFAAFDLALEHGADALELDVRMTRDGVAVVLHDRTLARTTGDPRAIGAVHSSELPDLAGPPPLDAVLDRYGRAAGWLIELKDPTPAMDEVVARAIRERGISDIVTVQSFCWDGLSRLRSSAPWLDSAPLLREGLDRRAVLTALWRAAGHHRSVGIHARCVDAGVVETAHALGLLVRAYTVNSPREMDRLTGIGIDGLITDEPGLARRVAGAAGPAAAAA